MQNQWVFGRKVDRFQCYRFGPLPNKFKGCELARVAKSANRNQDLHDPKNGFSQPEGNRGPHYRDSRLGWQVSANASTDTQGQ